MSECVFCRIVNNEIPSEKVGKSESFIAIKDLHPKAPVHNLLIPKRHIEKPDELDESELRELFDLSKNVAENSGVRGDGYRLIFNVGKKAGQEIDHVHLHLIGGSQAKSLY